MAIATEPAELSAEVDSAELSAEVWAVLRGLFRVHRLRFLTAASRLDLHPAQAGALLQLHRPLPMHKLAAELGCDNSNVTGLVDRLAARGLVAREPSPHDRRVRQVVLTAAGRRLRAQLLARIGPPAATGISNLSTEEQRQLLGLLRKIAD
jgi:MarR family transcriptional regulator, organic hydroperoxide resistance regulator